MGRDCHKLHRKVGHNTNQHTMVKTPNLGHYDVGLRILQVMPISYSLGMRRISSWLGAKAGPLGLRLASTHL